MFGLKLIAALTAVGFPAGAGLLGGQAASPEGGLAILVFGVTAGLVGMFSFADAEAAEEAAYRERRQLGAGTRFAPLDREDGA